MSRQLPAVTRIVDHLEEIVREAGAGELCRNVGLRRNPEAYADGALHFANPSWSQHPAGRELLARLSGLEICESARQKGPRLTFRLRDDWVAAIGEALAAGQEVGLEAGGLLGGRRICVDFYGANATKALHVGHLRNTALGFGIAAVLDAAGARVTRVCHGADVGRQVAEAVAGYAAFHAGEDPAARGLKPDHFVGACYSDFVSTVEEPEPAGAPDADTPVAREMAIQNDLAQEYMERWRAGDPEIRGLWGRISSWARQGQDQTLARLGVRLDRMLYESETMDRGDAIVADGLARGILTRNPDGSVIYETGTPQYPAMVLVRQDGYPTAHLRDFIILGMLLREQSGEIDDYVQLCGDEWAPAVAVYRELLARLSPVPFNEKHQMVFHGMVTLGGAKIKSSGEGQPLIDEILDDVQGSARLARLLQGAGPLSAEELTRIVLLGHFVSRSPVGPIEFIADRFVDDLQAAGWQLAEAWSKANRQSAGPGSGPDPRDPGYRFFVLQSQRFRSALLEAAAARDPSVLAKYLLLLTRFYLDGDFSPAVDRVLRTVLRRGLASLGLLPRSP
jgi:arginyl-tRNA synthetase